MKVLFAGPSIVGLKIPDEIVLREPAAQGDIVRATLDGATAIGLVDGLFEDVASVWHKDILFALSAGVRVCGAASMGALRAVECAAFGMVGIGSIYQRYASGDLDDDAAVAQLHAPAELGFVGITEPLVNVEATIDALRRDGRLGREEAEQILARARALHFKERTYARIVDELQSVSADRRVLIASTVRTHGVDVKRQDAEDLVRYLRAVPSTRKAESAWRLSVTKMFRSTLERQQARANALI